MSSGLRAPTSRTGLARPTIARAVPRTRPSGLARPSAALATARGELPTPRRGGAGGVKPSASSHSTSGLSRSSSTASIGGGTSVQVGSHVALRDSDLQGVVRFHGEVEFAKGIWVGVELPDPRGKNNGQVKGVQYFECPDLHGIFCKPEKVILLQSSSVMKPNRTPSSNNLNDVDYEAKFGLRIGCKVLVNDAKIGTLLYLGQTEFAKGVWAGVALDTPDGKNDGSVKGKRYFTCDPGYGLFAQATKIQLAESPLTSRTSSLSSFETPKKIDGDNVMKPDFANRGTPASVTTSLSGILRSKSRDIETMQRDIGDLQQRLSEVNNRTPTNKPNGVVHRTPRSSTEQNSYAEMEKMKKQNDESEREKIDLLSKLRLAENDKLLLETSVAELKQSMEEEQHRMNQKVDLLNKEMVVLKSSHEAQRQQLQVELNRTENELTTALEKAAEFEAAVLSSQSPESAAELELRQNRISELETEVEHLKQQIESFSHQVAELEVALAESAEQKASIKAEQNVANEEESLQLQQTIKDLNSKLTDTSNENQILKSDLESERAVKAQLDGDLVAAQNLNENLHLQLNQIKTTSEEEISVLSGEVTTLKTALEDLNIRLRDNASSNESEVTTLKLEVEQLTRDLEGARDQSTRDNEKIRSLEDMLAASQSGSDQQLLETQKRVSDLEGQMSDLIASHKEELSSYITQVANLQQENTQSRNQVNDLNSQLEVLKSSHNVVLGEKADFTAQQQTTISSLEAELACFNKLKEEHGANLEAMATLEVKLRERDGIAEELAASKKQVSELQQQLTQGTSLTAQSEAEVAELRVQLAERAKEEARYRTVAEEEAERSRLLQLQVSEYEEQVKLAEEQLHQLAEQVDAKNTEVSQLLEDKTVAARKLVNLEDDRARLQSQLNQLSVQYNGQSQEETENLNRKVNNLTTENEQLRASIEERSTAFDELSAEVSTLREISETAFTELKKNEVQFTESVKKLKTTQVQLDDAIDRTRKLQIKVNDLEEEVVRERARANDLEQRLGPNLSYEEVEDLSNLSNSPLSSPRYVPNRMFCDNCDVFDAHDTDACPLNNPSPGGVRHGGHRGPSGRPYCTICETEGSDCDHPFCDICMLFGHTAEECEDDMTF